MGVLNLQKAIRSLEKTPVILKKVLQGVTQETAQHATDGAAGWSVLFILCHLRDYEAIFLERVRLTVERDTPRLEQPLSNDELTRAHDYAHQQMDLVVADLAVRRDATLAYIRTLDDTQLARVGIHPFMGASTALEFIVNIALHDIDHTAQIQNALEWESGKE